MFPLVSQAVARIVPIERLRWITFGHVESDECGAMTSSSPPRPAPRSRTARPAAMVSLDDLCDRPPAGSRTARSWTWAGRRVRHIDTPHVPHNWEARVLFERPPVRLFCGDL